MMSMAHKEDNNCVLDVTMGLQSGLSLSQQLGKDIQEQSYQKKREQPGRAHNNESLAVTGNRRTKLLHGAPNYCMLTCTHIQVLQLLYPCVCVYIPMPYTLACMPMRKQN